MSDNDEPPALEGAAGGDSDSSDGGGDSKASRIEKKTRKALLKLGMKKVSGIERALMRKPKNQVFVLSKPDVYKSPNSDTYAFFGEFKSGMGGPEEFASGLGGMQAPGDYRPPAAAPPRSAPPAAAAAAAAGGAAAGGDADDSGLEEKDIQLVVEQANVSRAAAVAALKKSGGDIVNAIMSLST